jgi:hypothetical protein
VPIVLRLASYNIELYPHKAQTPLEDGLTGVYASKPLENGIHNTLCSSVLFPEKKEKEIVVLVIESTCVGDEIPGSAIYNL